MEKNCDTCEHVFRDALTICRMCSDFDRWEPKEKSERNISDITDERGNNYGHPADHFLCTQDMFSCWDERRADALKGELVNYNLEYPLRHIVYMICDKLARAAQNPMHQDNWDDIQGYASLWRKCVERDGGE